MSASFTAQTDYLCAHCHRLADAELHVYEETLDVLVFGHRCPHCRQPSEVVTNLLERLRSKAPLTVHYAELNTVWCLHCDRPTQVGYESMHEHLDDVHPSLLAKIT